MAIEDLTRLVPPPARPVDADGDWAGVEARLGLTLPADFKALARTYGHGQFVDHVSPLGPARLLERAGRIDGLLEWAADNDGVSYCWSTDTWQVALWSASSRPVERFDLDATGFLAAWLGGELRPRPIIAPPAVAPWFQPFRERRHANVGLSDSDLPYEERLQVLKDALAPVQERGNTLLDEDDEDYDEDEDPDEDRQDFFAAVERDWIITYETSYGHQIRFAYPPEDDDAVRAFAATIAPAMGAQITRTTDNRGARIW
jgi:hypothetical protein